MQLVSFLAMTVLPEFEIVEFNSQWYKQSLLLREEILRRPLGLDFSEQDLQGENAQLHFGLINNEQLIACVVAKLLNDQAAKLRQMAVAESMQSRGYGRMLIQQVERDLYSRGFRRIELHARKTAQQFYQNLGYQVEGAEFTELGLPHQKMSKTLSTD